jgi:hypothetical protein
VTGPLAVTTTQTSLVTGGPFSEASDVSRCSMNQGDGTLDMPGAYMKRIHARLALPCGEPAQW